MIMRSDRLGVRFPGSEFFFSTQEIFLIEVIDLVLGPKYNVPDNQSLERQSVPNVRIACRNRVLQEQWIHGRLLSVNGAPDMISH